MESMLFRFEGVYGNACIQPPVATAARFWKTEVEILKESHKKQETPVP